MTLPPVKRPPHVDVYELVSDTPGYKFMALCHPVGQQAVRVFGDTREGTVKQLEGMMKK